MFIDDDKLSQIVEAVYLELKFNPLGIKSSELNKKVSQRLNWKFCHTMLNCSSEFEFVKKYIMCRDSQIEFQLLPSDEHSLTENKEFLFRSKNIMRQYVDQ